MVYTYKTKNTCSKEIQVELEGNIIKKVLFLGGGCPGNLQALPRLVEGRTVEDILSRITGIKCGFKGTSCADQLSIALTKAYDEEKALLNN